MCTVRRRGDRERDGPWNDLADALPLRSRNSVRDYLQRRYQDKVTGRWSKQEIELLKESVRTSDISLSDLRNAVGRDHPSLTAL